jgi:hypothetical protein
VAEVRFRAGPESPSKGLQSGSIAPRCSHSNIGEMIAGYVEDERRIILLQYMPGCESIKGMSQFCVP